MNYELLILNCSESKDSALQQHQLFVRGPIPAPTHPQQQPRNLFFTPLSILFLKENQSGIELRFFCLPA